VLGVPLPDLVGEVVGVAEDEAEGAAVSQQLPAIAGNEVQTARGYHVVDSAADEPAAR